MVVRKQGRKTRSTPLGSVDDVDKTSSEASNGKEKGNEVVQKVNDSEDDSSEDSSDDEESKAQIEEMQNKLKALKRKRKDKKRKGNAGTGTESSETMETSKDTLVHPINQVHVNTSSGTNSAVSCTTNDFLLANYVSNCEKRGLMDTESDVSVIVMRVTRRSGWPLFKMLDDEDYSAGSNFAMFIMKKIGRNPATDESKLWWASIKQYVSKSMQNSRSVTTQSMKKVFIGKITWKANVKTLSKFVLIKCYLLCHGY
jgi:hypothetical protein